VAVIVTGAAGDLGSRISEVLIQHLPPNELILVSRNTAALERFAQRGAQVRWGDFDKPDSLPAAFAGGDRLLLISTLDVGERRRRQHRAAIEAARTAGVQHVVYTSSVGIHPRNPCFVIPDHAMTEELLRASGIKFTILRMSSYAEILVQAVAPHAIASGRWITSAGDGRVAFVSKADCARAAAQTLITPGHEGAVYEITGPELLSYRDAATMASAIYGCQIEYVVTRDEPESSPAVMRRREHADEWIGSFSIDQLKSYERAVRDGFYAICTGHVEFLTKQPATSLRELYLTNLDRLSGRRM